jgi:phospholipid transport system substrate-binding protein
MCLKRLACAFVMSVALAVRAGATAEPEAAQVIGAFDDTLLSVMKNAASLGFEGRYDRLQGAIDHTFNLPLMTRIVIGSHWAGLTAADREAVTAAFRRFVIATYARRFDGYGGENFRIDETRPTGSGLLVRTELLRPDDPPVTLTYVFQDDGTGRLLAVDVFLTGTISELATRRSEFGAILDRDGVPGLLKALEQKSAAKLL